MLHAAARRRPRRTRTGVPLPRVDGRTIIAKRYASLVESYSAELGGELTEAERSLVQQAAALQLQAERLQEAIVRGEAIDSDTLIRVSSTSKRLLSIIASKAGKRKPAAPSLQDYLATAYPRDAEIAEPEASEEP